MIGANGRPSKPRPSSSTIDRGFGGLRRKLAPGHLRFVEGSMSSPCRLLMDLRLLNHILARIMSTTTAIIDVMPMIDLVCPPGYDAVDEVAMPCVSSWKRV